MKLNLHEVKDQFSKYIEMVESGEIIIVCKRNVPVAEIRPIEKKEKRTPELGSARVKSVSLKTFFRPMSEADLRVWEEGDEADPLRKYSPQKVKRKK
ncbi:MAG TPA: type II toxin-antitoxin system prevent-host-death family antitoxin [Terriglobia bacterium]|nr:type II toxin-antitoxin system prevent-host-death family antitoxin [Terriglobia bacterium]